MRRSRAIEVPFPDCDLNFGKALAGLSLAKMGPGESGVGGSRAMRLPEEDFGGSRLFFTHSGIARLGSAQRVDVKRLT